MEYDKTHLALRVLDQYLARFTCDVVEIVVEPYEDGTIKASVVYVDDGRFGGDGEQIVFRLNIEANTVIVVERDGIEIQRYEIDEQGNEL